MAISWLTAAVLAIVVAAPASAAKWEGGCPKVRYKRYAVGRPITDVNGSRGAKATAPSKIFEHVGHEVTFEIDAANVAVSGGGFSTEPGGNTLEVIFTPPKHAPEIPLPPIPFTATTPGTATVVIPDSRPLIGRLLVGRARLIVRRGTKPLFEVRKWTILPPMNDVRMISQQGYGIEALAAMDWQGRIWIPMGFSGFGGGGESLPECPTELTPVTAFAVDLSLKKGHDLALPYLKMGNLKQNRLWLGDYILSDLKTNADQNMYGNKLPSKLNVKPLGGNAVALCSLNDAIQLVLEIKLQNSALGTRSELLPIVQDGSPLLVKIENVSADEQWTGALERLRYDSLSTVCYPPAP